MLTTGGVGVVDVEGIVLSSMIIPELVSALVFVTSRVATSAAGAALGKPPLTLLTATDGRESLSGISFPVVTSPLLTAVSSITRVGSGGGGESGVV